MANETTAKIAGYEWSFGRNFDNSYSFEAISASAALETLKEARAQTALLRDIKEAMLSLGRDGIHTVIVHARDKANRERVIERKRRAAKLRRTRARNAAAKAAKAAQT